MKNPIKGALHIAKMRRLGKGPKIADLKGIENSPLMKQRRSIPYTERQPFALGGQPTENVDATQQQPQNQQQQVQQQPQQQQVAPQTPMAPPTDRASLISNLYNQYLGRNPNQEEVGYWQGQASPEVIYQGISGSQAAKDYYTGQYNQANPQQYISSLYQNYMGRAPNQDEINYWQGQLSQGVNPSQVLNTISSDIGSRANMYSQMAAAPFASNTQWLNNVYQANMGRNANADEQQYWQGQFDKGVSPDQVASTIENDPGAVIPRLYRDYLGRDPNQDEFNYWQGEMKKGRSAGQVEQAISNDVSTSNFIEDQYQGLMGRNPEPEELNYWRDQMAKGMSPSQVTNIISNDQGSQNYQASNFGAYQVAGGMPSGQVTNSGLQNNYAGRLGAVVGNLGNRAADFVSSTSDAIKNYFAPLAGIESTGNPIARAGSSNAAGLFQFIPSTWLDQFNKVFGSNTGLTKQQILNLRTEDSAAGQAINKALAASYAQEGEAKLQSAGLPATPENLYSVHFLGNTGLAKLNASNPNALAGSAMNADQRRRNASYARMRVGDLFQLFNKKLNDPARVKPAQATFAKYSVSPMPEGAPGPYGEIPVETTPASGGSGNTYNSAPFNSDEQATQNFLRDYLYDSNVRGTNVLNLGGGSSGGGPGGGSGSGGSSAGTPGSHAGTHGAPAIPTVYHPVSHGSGSVSFAPPASSGGGSGTIDPYFGHAGSTRYDPRWGSGVGGPSSDWEIDYARKRGGSVTHDNIRKRGIDALQTYASGGKVWERKRPKSLGKPEKLDKDQKRSAKAAAKAAGRPYPNLIDNMRAAQKADGGEIKAAIKLAHKRLTHES